MTTTQFDSEYKGKKVILVTNEETQGNISAEIDGIETYITHSDQRHQIRYKKDGIPIYFEGLVIEDSETTQALLELLKTKLKTQKAIYTYLAHLKNFGSNLKYACSLTNSK
jgi:hypothetical protein